MKLVILILLLIFIAGCGGNGKIPTDSLGIPSCYCEGHYPYQPTTNHGMTQEEKDKP
jgi:hypothetical protein